MNDIESTTHRGVQYLKMGGITDEQLDRLVALGYFECPASSGHHLACRGGLAEHSMTVANKLIEQRAFSSTCSAYKVGMLHDLVKLYNYKPDESGTGWKWHAAPYPGHGAASVMIANEIGVRLDPVETAAITWHMGLFGCDSDDRREEFDMAVRRFPREVILTHACDFLASVIEDPVDNESRLYFPGNEHN